jgi:hypothetical protein
VRAIRLSIEAVDTRLEDASWTLGANRFLVFATVTLPLALPASSRHGAALPRRSASSAPSRSSPTSGRDADHFGGDLCHAIPNADAAAAARGDRDHHLAHCAGGVEWLARARHASCTGCDMLLVDVEKRLGDFAIRAKFQGRTA